MSHYRYHVFFCTNERASGAVCCGRAGAAGLRDYLKGRAKALGLEGPGGVRVSLAGCMGRCALGPVIVVYPEGIWYSYASQQDIEEILTEHLVGGRVVERLVIPA